MEKADAALVAALRAALTAGSPDLRNRDLDRR
jgi:hypothetical protein